MSNQPPSLPLDLVSSTFATTPAPSSISVPVPSVSLTNTSPRDTFPPFAVEQTGWTRRTDPQCREVMGGDLDPQRQAVGIVERGRRSTVTGRPTVSIRAG